MKKYTHLKTVREEVVCSCGQKWLQVGAPFGWKNEEHPKHTAGMEEIIIQHQAEEGTLLHQQIHRCFCGAVIMVLLRTEEDTITAGHMEVYPTHSEVLNEDLIK